MTDVITDIQQSIHSLMINVFGHPYLAGIAFLIFIFAGLYKSGVPGDGALVISAILMIALSGAFLPEWIMGFVAMGIGTIIAVGLYRLFFTE